MEISKNLSYEEHIEASIIRRWGYAYATFGEAGLEKHKIYLSVILDLCDRRPVAFVYSSNNDISLVFDTFDKAVVENPEATPIFHSDRGYQYTSRAFRQRILDAGITQSMSRVGRCIDNGPMEGFWGLMKREMYYEKNTKQKKN